MASLDAQYAVAPDYYSILQDAQNHGLIYLGTNLGSIDRWIEEFHGARVAANRQRRNPRLLCATPRKAPARRAPLAKRVVASSRVSESVRRAQNRSNAAGYLIGYSDGARHTDIAAVRRFQSDRSLPVLEL